MRIALVTEFYYPTLGGVQEHIYHFARHARRRGHEVTIITGAVQDLPPPRAEVEDGVIRLGRSLAVVSNGSVGRVTFGTGLGRALERLLTRKRFDVVHCHAHLSPVLPLIAPRRTGLPIIGTLHTNFPESALMRFFQPQLQWIVDRMSVNIAVSAACIRANQTYVRGDFRVIPNGVDCAMWQRGRPFAWKRNPTALFIGRLEERCGLDRVLRAWPLLPANMKAELLVLGDGPLRSRYEQMALSGGVPARFLGAVRDERPDYFATADVMVCPTTIASFGITLLEGMAAGLPIVASDIDGFREILTHDREGVLVDTADPGALASHLTHLLEDRPLRERYGQAGRVTAAGYDWSRISDRILDVYQEVV